MTIPNEQSSSPDRSPSAPIAGAKEGPPEYGAPPESGDETRDQGTLQAALAAAEQKSLEHRDLYMRALAELDNVRKRAARDVEQAHKYAIDRFANDLIGVKDSLELGLASEASGEALREGTEATAKLLSKAFEKAGMVEINPLGETFNPEFHEAMAMMPSTEHVPNTVSQVVQKGYLLNGRLLRPARVIVTREP